MAKTETRVPSRVDFQGTAMGTHINFVAYTNASIDEVQTRRAFSAALNEIQRLEKLMTSWRNDSELAEINERAGQFVAVSEETFSVIDKSLWAGRISDGAFDITFQTLSSLWKFGAAAEQDASPPSAKEVVDLLPHVGYEKIELKKQPFRVRVPRGTQIGLGGIAKGYAVDRAADVLRRAGVRDFLVQAGGDLYGAGRKPDGSAWISGIQDPRGEKGQFFATIELSDHAFSTAGDYARAYVKNGKRYHHIIDPKTGFPATASRSVTIWAKDAFIADAVDDAVFVLGAEKGLELVERLEGVGAVIVDSSNQVWLSDRLKGKVRLLKPPSPGP